MKKTFFLLWIAFWIISLNVNSLGLEKQAQRLRVDSVRHKASADFIHIDYLFNRNINFYKNFELNFRTTTIDGAVFPISQINPENSTIANALTFKIPKSVFTNKVRIEFWVVIKRLTTSSRASFTSHRSFIDLTHRKDSEKELKNLKDKVSTSEAEKKKLEEENRKVKTTNTGLQKSLNKILEGLYPTSITFDKVELVTDDKIAVSFKTNKPARIQATIKSLSGFNKIAKLNNVEEEHTIIFEGLTKNTTYSIKAEVLSLESKTPLNPNISVSADDVNDLNITTTDTISPPVATAEIKTLAEKFEISLKSNQKVFAEVRYYPIAADGTPSLNKTKKIGTITKNEIGIFSGDQIVPANNGQKKIEVLGLKPNSKYKIEIKLVSEQGKTPANIFDFYPQTTPKPKEFNFDKAVRVQISPLGAKVIWNSTTTADSATLKMIYEGDTSIDITDKSPDIADKKITANIDVPNVLKMIVNNKVPIIRLSMKKGQKTVQRDMQVTFFMPTRTQILNNPNIKGEVKTALLETTKRIVDKKRKLDWGTVLKTGLSIFVKTFVPIP